MIISPIILSYRRTKEGCLKMTDKESNENINKIKAFVGDQSFTVNPDRSGYGTNNFYCIDCLNGKIGSFQIKPSDIKDLNEQTETVKGYWIKFKEEIKQEGV
jgi:hypothetical protein